MVVFAFFTLVLAVRASTSNPQGVSVRGSVPDVGTQPQYRFTRQPVKYYRHHNAGTRLSFPHCATRRAARPKRGSRESADSSRSPSPEPETQRCLQNSDGHRNNTQQPHQVTPTAKGIKDSPLSPREVVEFMLGLDLVTSPAAGTSSSTTQRSAEEVETWWQFDQNINMNNNRHCTGQNLSSSPKNICFEHNLTSPAQKILSGLKLRRSHSGKDEQLFV